MPDSRWLRQVTLRVRTLFQRNRVESEIEEEFQFHIEQRIELEIARGLSPEEARSVALRAMDGVQQRKEECRDMRRVNYIDDLLRDLRYAGRNLRRSPGFATLAVLINGSRHRREYSGFQRREHRAPEAAFVSRSGSNCGSLRLFEDPRGLHCAFKASLGPRLPGLARPEFLF